MDFLKVFAGFNGLHLFLICFTVILVVILCKLIGLHLKNRTYWHTMPYQGQYNCKITKTLYCPICKNKHRTEVTYNNCGLTDKKLVKFKICNGCMKNTVKINGTVIKGKVNEVHYN